jgi:hypothetical protein
MDLVRYLSLDVALGALGGGCMAVAYLGISMPWAWYVLLPLAVWVIYTSDHLLDAQRLGERASTGRHRFHVKYLVPLSLIAGAVALFCLGLALVFLGEVGVLFGLAMGGLVVVHLMIVRVVGTRTSKLLAKELGVAVVYALGIWGLPLLVSEQMLTASGLIPCFQFLLLALVNLLEFSLFEFETDALDGHTSFVRALGKRRSIQLIRILLGIVATMGVALLLLDDVIAVIRLEMVYGIMAAMLGLLLYRKAWFSVNERYRAWGDAAFLLPFFYMILAWR